MTKLIDLTGQKFGKLTVLKRDECYKGRTHWVCRCECGITSSVSGGNLKSGHTQSCGCYNKQRTGDTSRTHGMSNSRFYRIWRKMLERCSYKENDNYKYYGGRRIKVCKEWLEFMNFYNDMYPTYNSDLTLDRINANGNYEKSNCRWATKKEQNLNRRTNHMITYKGETLPISEMALKYNLAPSLVITRIDSLKWSVEKALTKPIRKVKRRRNNELQETS